MRSHKRGFLFIISSILFVLLIIILNGTVTSADSSESDDGQVSSLGEWRVFLPELQVSQSAGFIQHDGLLLAYHGAETCLECHQEEVNDFGASNHYLWKGKFGSLNDFCGLPDINFGPGKMTTVDGDLVDGGCAKCHAGMGERPTTSNPENADCLVCHAEDYRRTLVDVDGVWRFQPDRMNMPDVITIQGEPTRDACLTCHAYAGGGHNNKRGDISNALVNPSRNQDVHMSSEMTCVDCHLTDSDHHIAGRGVDLLIDEGVAMAECSSCHGDPKEFHISDVDRHLDHVACQSCHIPIYARAVSTDMLRDFQASELTSAGLYEPEITRQANVMPEYAFWNGDSGFYPFKDPAVEGQVLAWPLGDINNGKLYPFKLHHAIQPQDPITKAILPPKAGILFQTGNLEQAILVGAADAGISLPQGYIYVETQRWMGIFHEMPPAEMVLNCDDCHESADRIDFEALGYIPVTFRDGKRLCISCHEAQDPLSFYRLHEEHAEDEQIACAECHDFER